VKSETHFNFYEGDDATMVHLGPDYSIMGELYYI